VEGGAMIAALELDGSEAQFCPETMTVHCEGLPVGPPLMVHVCDWCDPKKFLTRSLVLAGYKVSRGVCRACVAKFKR